MSGISETDWAATILRRELARHASCLWRLAEKVSQADDYPTDTPRKLAEIIRNTAKLIATRLGAAPADKLQHVHMLLDNLSQHLRIVERARTPHTPWSIVEPIERFLKHQVGPGHEFIIRPQWAYNYAIVGEFVDAYGRAIGSLEDWITPQEWKDAIGDSGSLRIYSISFPRVERLNVLLHVNWGHEVGHILATRWIGEDSGFPAIWVQNVAGIEQRIRHELTKTWNPDHSPLFLEQTVSAYVSDTMSVARDGIKELLCDTVGAHLFGPAAMASLCEHAARFNLDRSPLVSQGYPPWRYRLRKVAEFLIDDLAEDRSWEADAEVLEPYVEWLRQGARVAALKTAGGKEPDQAVLDSDIRTREAYQFIADNWRTIRAGVLQWLPADHQAAYRLHQRMKETSELVSRLQAGIPPNEMGTWPHTRPAHLVDIWNAAWAYKFYQLKHDLTWGSLSDCEALFRLTLKAIEASYVHLCFGRKIQDGDEE